MMFRKIGELMANKLNKTLQCALLSALIMVFTGLMSAVADENFPGQEPDRRVLRTQEKVDSLFEKGDYERAMFIYREELAPRGDKFAQYMIGYMYLTGKGVSQDIIEASAWYRLAAERGQEVFVGARDEVLMMLDDSALLHSDKAYRQLRSQLSDVALLSGMIQADLEILRRYTQSRPAAMRSFQESFDKRTALYEPVVEQLLERLDYLIDLSLTDDFDPAVEQKGIELLEAEVLREIELFHTKY
jgi:hypothetical protein